MGKGKGGKGGNGNKPFWRQFVDPSDDPAVIGWCRDRIKQFLASGKSQEEVEWLSNSYRNTIRHLATEMGVAWIKVNKGVYALARSTRAEGADPAKVRKDLVAFIAKLCEEAGGRVWVSHANRALSTDQWAAAATLKLRKLNNLLDVCKAECEEAGIRMNDRRNCIMLGEADGYEDAVFVRFNHARLLEARRALHAAISRLPKQVRHTNSFQGLDFLQARCPAMSQQNLKSEMGTPEYRKFRELRSRLPAFQQGEEICAAVERNQVTLVLGATGCGKTTQIPQLLLEAAAIKGQACRLVATQPRRLSAVSVAERVAVERGQRIGERVAYKIRFEDNVSDKTQLVFCTVGILLKIMQSNPNLEGATHIVVDEVHERDLHTDFLLTLLRRVLEQRKDLKVVLMSATVDPSAFQAYFTDAETIQIPGKTNYPIEELFLENILGDLPERSLSFWRNGAPGKSKASAFSQGALPNLPVEKEAVAQALGLGASQSQLAEDIAWAHAATPEDIDYILVQLVVEQIHASGEEGGILIFMPGWGEIVKTIEALQGSAISRDLELHPLHSRIPTAEQQKIFKPPTPGKRKVIVSTILAETSITVEDVVFVVDTGRSRSTFFNEDSKVSALRTVWYSKANGFQRRGRSGRCRPGKWYRLFSSLQWEQMQEYELPEMLRSPLEELCLEVSALGLGSPLEFLRECISPPPQDTVEHAVELLHNLGAVADHQGDLTVLGQKLANIQVHPMLGKMLLLGALFRCFEHILTICASLGYKSPFVCPMGKEREANEAKRKLADGSKSDLVALANAYNGWLQGRGRFANQHFLSHQTLDYIHRLRGDLSGAARDVIKEVPEEYKDNRYMFDVCRAVLVAGLFPNLAWIRRRGKGQTLSGLKVCMHPGSVNSQEGDVVVAFYDIQETADRYLYDTTVVSMAPCLLFAPSLKELHRGKRVVFQVNNWEVAVAPEVADDLMELRELLNEFISRSVGERPKPVHLEAIDTLCKLFEEGSSLEGADDEEEDTTNEASTPRVQEDAWSDTVGGSTAASIQVAAASSRPAGSGGTGNNNNNSNGNNWNGHSNWGTNWDSGWGGSNSKRDWNSTSQDWSSASKGKWQRR